ncbi:MAG: XRE family transcriptional regulator [Ruminococcaceae bacterium]|nr:XRE family transcriptional regulator [Oscillospiraceae bacterium]
MDIPAKIRMAEAYAKISEADLARRLNTTPQAFGQRMKTGKFSSADLEKIAEALGAEIKVTITFPDGTQI